MAFQLITERLVIEEFTAADTNFIISLLNSEGWIKYIGERNVKTTEQALDYIAFLRKPYVENGFGFWKVSLKENHVPIGMSGLIKREGLPHVDIGFALLPEYFHQGYALESAIAVKQFALDQLGLEELLAITNTDNTASMKLLLKIGLDFDKNIVLNNEELSLFRLKK